MSNASNPSFPDFGKLVPGFDFLQNLTKQAAGVSQAVPQLPNLANWIAPTLNVEELDKRVQELKAVQFWLDQNAAALKATIQALEVQKMTLATLKGMNFNMGDVANAFKLKVGDTVAGGMQQMADKAKTFAGLDIPPSTYAAEKAEAAAGQDAGSQTKPSSPATSAKSGGGAAKPGKPEVPAAPPMAGLADPMQWWGALTQQFQAIAADAMKEAAKNTALDITKTLAKDAVKTATSIGSGLAKNMAATTSKTIASGARAAMGTALGSVWPKPGPAQSSAASGNAGSPAPAATRKTASSRKRVDKPPTKPAVRKSAARKTIVSKAAVTKTRR